MLQGIQMGHPNGLLLLTRYLLFKSAISASYLGAAGMTTGSSVAMIFHSDSDSQKLLLLFAHPAVADSQLH